MELPRREAFDASTVLIGIAVTIALMLAGVAFYGPWGWVLGVIGGALATLAVAESRDSSR